MNWIRQTLRCSALLGGLLLIGAPVWAQTGDPVHGAALFTNTNGAPVSCATSGCHNGFPTTTRNSITRGANNGPRILSAINGNTGGMAVLMPFVSTQDAADLGAYIANPTGVSGPAISVTPSTLSFTQTVGTTSIAQSITVANPGNAALTISAIAAHMRMTLMERIPDSKAVEPIRRRHRNLLVNCVRVNIGCVALHYNVLSRYAVVSHANR